MTEYYVPARASETEFVEKRSRFIGRVWRVEDEAEAKAAMERVIADGSAKKKLAEFVAAQGGDASYVFDKSLLPVAGQTCEVKSDETGYVHRILAEDIGIACMTLGGGRETKESVIDLSVGIILKKKNGDFVKEEETLAVIYGNDAAQIEAARQKIKNAYEIQTERREPEPVVRKYIFPE